MSPVLLITNTPWSSKYLSQILCSYMINLICEILPYWISLYPKGIQLEDSFYIDSDCVYITKNHKHDVIFELIFLILDIFLK